MKLFRTLLLAACGALFAQSQTTFSNILLLPFGTWVMCQGPNKQLAESYGWCTGVAPGSYVLLYHGDAASATDFEYTLSARIKGVEAPEIVTGTFRRNDNAAGYSSTIVWLKGMVDSYDVTVRSLAPVREESASARGVS